MLVQVYLHKPGQADAAAALAAEVDVEAARRGGGELLEPIATGTVIDIELEMPGLMIAETEQRIVWRDRPTRITDRRWRISVRGVTVTP